MRNDELKIAIIGKSAAGKSAFIKSFSQSADLIDSEGDAQTTRTYAEYKFYVTNEEIQPRVFAKILSKNDFIEKRLENAILNICTKLKIDQIDATILKDKISRSDRYKKVFIESILHMSDFFDVTEFDYLYKNEQPIAIQAEIVLDDFLKKLSTCEVTSEEIPKVILTVYELIYDETIKRIKAFYLSTGTFFEDNNEYIFNFVLTNESKNTLSMLLKVTDDDGRKSSLTSMVTKVVLESAISNYYFIGARELGIKKLSLIDTFGLDHSRQANTDVLQERYNRIFNTDYPDITVVFYVVALHKGTSSDLQEAISVLYSQRPDLMSYIIGTYIDENTRDEFTNEWLVSFDKTVEKMPRLSGQILEYLYGDDIIVGLMDSCISENMAEKRTEVMRNRFAPFCGKSETYSSDAQLLQMNNTSVKALLYSIANVEHLGSNYIGIDYILEKLEKSTYLDAFITLFIETASSKFVEIFNRAQSRTKGKIRKNLSIFLLGFDGSTLDATWKRVLRDAYNIVFTKEISISDKGTYSLAEDFNLDGNMKVAFNEVLNLFFIEWFERRCGDTYFNKKYVSEVNCSKCCKANEFNGECAWSTFVKIVGIDNMTNKPEDMQVGQWLVNIHSIKDIIDDDQRNEVIKIFKMKFRTEFIEMCRQHNARIAANIIKSKKDVESFSQLKINVFKEYVDDYDKTIDKDYFNKMVSFGLARS